MERDIIQYYFYSGLITFLLLLIVFKIKKIDKPLEKIKFWAIWTASTLFIGTVTIIFLTVFIINLLFPANDYISKPFDNKLWLTETYKRTEIIDDLIESKLLDHKSKADIIHLLGHPLDSCGYFVSTGRDMIYHLGAERHPFGVDSEWLLIWLENDTVKKYEVRAD